MTGRFLQPVPAVSPLGRDRRFESLFNTLSDDPNLEYALIDRMIVQAHQKATGAKRGTSSGHRALARGIGCENWDAGGGFGKPRVGLAVPGRSHDMTGVAPPIHDVSIDVPLADSRSC